MTNKQAIRAYQRVIDALCRVEAAIDRGNREDSDSDRGEETFEPPWNLEDDVREYVDELSRMAEELENQPKKKKAA